MATFSAWDYVVFVIMLIISASIGVYYRFTGGRQKTVSEYLLGDRNMPVLPVSFSLMASFMSAITLVGVSNENYQFGTLFLVINISYGLATPIAAYLYLPVFFKLQVTSAYEYLEKRFGKATRTTASVAYVLQMVLYMGIVLYAPALALEAVTGLSKTVSIFLIGLVCTFYSTIGGMKAVLLTDVFQSILMFAAIYSIIICAAVKAGGMGAIWAAAEQGGRLELWNFDPDPTTRHTWFSLIIGGGFTYLSLYAVNQTQVQRLMTLKNLKLSQLALWLNWPILSLLSFSTSLSGLALYSYYKDCDPLLQGRIQSRDQLMPLFVVDAMGHLSGLPGLFVSGIFSASLSTVSASMNSLAAVTLEDYMKPLYFKIKKKPLLDDQSTLPSKITATIFGIVCIGVAFIAQNLGGVLQASLTIFGVVGGPLFALFTLGMFTTTANQRGSITGLICGVAFSMWVGFGRPKPPLKMLSFSTQDCSDFGGFNVTSEFVSNIPNASVDKLVSTETTIIPETEYFYLNRLSYMWAGVLGFLVTFIVGLGLSYVLKRCNAQGKEKMYLNDDKTSINTDLFSPPVAKRLKRQMARFIENGGNFEISDRKM